MHKIFNKYVADIEFDFVQTIKVLGEVLCSYRIAEGISQADMASAMGIARSSLSRIENGRSSLNMEQLCKLAQILAVPPSKLLQEAERISGKRWQRQELPAECEQRRRLLLEAAKREREGKG